MPYADRIAYTLSSSEVFEKIYAMIKEWGREIKANSDNPNPLIFTGFNGDEDNMAILGPLSIDALCNAGIKCASCPEMMTEDAFSTGVLANNADAGLYMHWVDNYRVEVALKDQNGQSINMEPLYKRTIDMPAEIPEDDTTGHTTERKPHVDVYAKMLSERWKDYGDFASDLEPIKVVLVSDGVAGMALLQRVLVNSIEKGQKNFEPIELSAAFRRTTNATFEQLAKATKASVIFDMEHDGGLLRVLDENAELIPPPVVTALLTTLMSTTFPESGAVIDYRYILGSITMVDEGFRVDGGKPGAGAIASQVRDTGAVFGATGDGNYIFRDLNWQTSNVFAALLLAKMLHTSGMKMSELAANVSDTYYVVEPTFYKWDDDPAMLANSIAGRLDGDLDARITRTMDKGVMVQTELDGGLVRLLVSPMSDGVEVSYEVFGPKELTEIAEKGLDVLDLTIAELRLEKNNA